MSVHQCPKCELKFSFRTEVDDHCWHDHPEFRHEYPAVAPHELAPEVEGPPTATTRTSPDAHHTGVGDLTGWLTPKRGNEHP